MLRNKYRFFLYLISTVCIFGCGLILPPLNPITNEERDVSIATNPEKKIIFNNSMVWYDNHRRNEGILFPKGTYILEAEDKEYFYFMAPDDLEFRSFKDGQTVDVKFVAGGLFLSKERLNMVPGGAYRNDGNTKKTLLWKLGSNFMRMEDEGWEKSY
jgi:hypothetical protein